MKSNKQRRLEIKAKRLKRAKKLLVLDTIHKIKVLPQDYGVGVRKLTPTYICGILFFGSYLNTITRMAFFQ